MDSLLTWWRENAVAFVLGSLAWTGVAASALRGLRAPIVRQRFAETAIAGWFFWLALGFVPWRAGSAVAADLGTVPAVVTIAARLVGQPVVGGNAWTMAIDCVGIVFAGAALLAAGHLLVAALLLRRVLRHAVTAPAAVARLLDVLPLQPRTRVRVLVSDLAWRPFCCGLLRPSIVLPRALLALPAPDAHLRAVLLHEIAHVTRGDLRGRHLFALAMLLQFWNPLFWMLRRHARDAAELLADEVAAVHHHERASYARSLISLAELLPAAREGRVAVLGVFGPEVHFCERMTMLLHRRVPLTIGCSRLQTALRSVASLAIALAAAACWTGPHGEVEATAAPVPANHDQGPRTFFAYDDTEVTKVIDTIAKISGTNIVVAPEVTGKVSLHVRGVPWRVALDAAVAQVGAHVSEDRDTLRVAR